MRILLTLYIFVCNLTFAQNDSADYSPIFPKNIPVKNATLGGTTRPETKKGQDSSIEFDEYFRPIVKLGQLKRRLPNKTMQDSIFKKGDLVKIPEIVYEGSVPCCFGKQKDSIQPIADFINKNKNLIVEIGGHTAHPKDVKWSKEISGLRVKKVWHYLVFDLKVDSNRVKYKAYGSTKPVVSQVEISNAKTKKEKEKLFQMNNRTELKILETNCIQDFTPLFTDKKPAVTLQYRRNPESNETYSRNKFITDSTFFANHTKPVANPENPFVKEYGSLGNRTGGKGDYDIYRIPPKLEIISDSSVFIWHTSKDSIIPGGIYDKEGKLLFYHGRARPSRAPKLKFTNYWADTMYFFIPEETNGICPAKLEIIYDNGDTIVEYYNFIDVEKLDYTIDNKNISIYFLVPGQTATLQHCAFSNRCTYKYPTPKEKKGKWSPPQPIKALSDKVPTGGVMHATFAKTEVTTDKRFWHGMVSANPMKFLIK